ncbi:MAG TPA: hypothetical protein VKA86_04350 [Candidatus Krumholzibacteria bacterium]|nr:hypothetical protein [Candidatus Krumholzibacteria bacterium]
MHDIVLWGAMLVFGAVLWRISPRVTSPDQFFGGRDRRGRDIGLGVLVASIVISWIFAKSITNAANLGRSFGLVGAVAYAGWYLSIPVAGVVIWRIRRCTDARSLPEFVTGRYGRMASLAFLLVVLVRLMNEVWSNTAVVGSYFGASGSASYLLAALVFTAITLAYSLRGGLRSSILTDVIQMGLGLFLLVFVMALVVPRSTPGPLLESGSWTLAGGVDLLLVAVLQSFSYPFHDPVLTDRAFLTRPRTMLRGYLLAGLVAATFIVVFGLVGVHARIEGIAADQDAPLRVAQAFGIAVTAVMTVLMMVSAGSTLDSTLSSVAKALVQDLGGAGRAGGERAVSTRVFRWIVARDSVALGRWAMLGAVVVGSLPLFAGAAIIKATTVSGTMVLGLAPAFLLFALPWAGPWAFHLGFWPGVGMGVLHATNAVPGSWAVGEGSYATLLGANLVGTLLVFGGFGVGALLDRARSRARTRALASTTALIALVGVVAVPTARADGPEIDLGGQTMLRLTTKMRDLDRPSTEVYNVRLLGRAEQDAWDFVAELRFRQTKLRSYSPSNTWLQQAYARWTHRDGELDVAAGLVYDQLGLFWDGSWFGNLPYLNGHKLDPDLNLQVHWDRRPSEGLGWEIWLQGSPGEDGLNGSFTTAARGERLILDAPDPEVSTSIREALALRARIRPSWRSGDWVIRPGVSVQRSVLDRTVETDEGLVTGHQTVFGTELTVQWRELRVFGEFLHEEIEDLGTPSLDRDFVLAGFEMPIWHSDEVEVRGLNVGASWQTADHSTEDFEEWFLTARVATRVNELLGFTAEYVRWELGDPDLTVLDRIEFIVHLHY